MNICKLFVLLTLVFCCQLINGQTIEYRNSIDPSVRVMTTQEMKDIKLLNSPKNLGIIAPFEKEIFIDEIDEANVFEDNGGFANRSSNSDVYNNGSPSNMLDKYNLKPSMASLGNGLPNFSEDLLHGKVNVSIPLLNFEYYDYSIPVSINNRYPQVVHSSYGEPTFYLNSRVGGDWTLSVDEFKVSRQLNGIEDEHPAKGYFTTTSLDKINNPSTITNDDVEDGLKGDWDPAMDVFHFSTPTISGSFLVDLNANRYEVLTKQKFHVEFEIENDQLHQFIITDGNGTRYLFGGDSSTIEVSQSITDVVSNGTYIRRRSRDIHVKHILEVQPSGIGNNVISYGTLGNNANLFVTSPELDFVPSTNGLFNEMVNNGIQEYIGFLVPLYSDINRRIYALPDYSGQNDNSAILDETYDDPDLRREKINTGWYLKKITLVNGKDINFNYNNQNWIAYPTYASNKIRINKAFTNNSDIPYVYVAGDGTVVELNNLSLYLCFPETLDPLKFPINESHTRTVNFVKKPYLTTITDEEGYQTLNINYNSTSHAPYYGSPNLYVNAPAETLNGGLPSRLIDNIYYTVRDCAPISACSKTIQFFNSSELAVVTAENGDTYRVPRLDKSYLTRLVIDDQIQYSFEYAGTNLARIHYPTGGIKEFSKDNFNTNGFSYNNWAYSLNPDPYLIVPGIRTARVTSIRTISENNTTVEEFDYENEYIAFLGTHKSSKTFKPDITSCTSGATFFSTAPVHNSHSSKNGLAYKKARKYVNGELRLYLRHNDFNHGVNYVGNTLQLTDESIPDYLDFITRPATFADQKVGNIVTQVAFKTDENGEAEPLSQTDISREYNGSGFEYAYPSVYLTKIEAGPWGSTAGGTKRGYSLYFQGLANDIVQEDITQTEYYDDGSFVTTQGTTKYEKTSIPSIGLNNYRVSESESVNSEGEVLKTIFTTPIEVEGLETTAATVSVQNLVFENLLSNNRVPVVEQLGYKNDNFTGITSNEFTLSSTNEGTNIAVPKNTQTLESQTQLQEDDFNSQTIDPNNSSQLIFDNRLRKTINFDQYDENGRLQEFHSLEDGIYTSVIWGYKNQYPIVVVKNARYSEISDYVADIKDYSDFHDTQQLIDAVNNLRGVLQQAQITSYTYTGKNLTTETDINGKTYYYEYDDSDRLVRTKDLNEHLLAKYRYHYRNVVDNPIDAHISISHNENTSTVVFTVSNITGGSGAYEFSWTLVEGGVINGSTTSNNLTVQYDCLTGLSHIDIELTVTDANDSNNSITLSRGFWELPCFPLVTADDLSINEVRVLNDGDLNFEGVYLDVIGLSGGSGSLRFDWSYQIGTQNFVPLVTAYNNHFFVDESYAPLSGICQNTVRMKCVITDLQTGQIVPLTQSGTTYIDCNDDPQ